jgi:hypothetical protein
MYHIRLQSRSTRTAVGRRIAEKTANLSDFSTRGVGFWAWDGVVLKVAGAGRRILGEGWGEKNYRSCFIECEAIKFLTRHAVE